MIDRRSHLAAIRAALARHRVVVLTGPRQCGKTTLARELVDADSLNYFDLEDPVSIARLDEPMTALRPLRGLVVIDEVQLRPDLFPVLRVLADRRKQSARFLILGSASGNLLRQSAESLAGRMERITLGGFSLTEVGTKAIDRLWRRGGFPRAYLARSETDSLMWRKQFTETLLQRDFPQPKIYMRDTGLLHQLLGIESEKGLVTHPKVGASWEGFVIEQVLMHESHDGAYFWATHQGAEMDLILRRGDRLTGVECKRTDAPRMTKSIRIALDDLGPGKVFVLYPGDKRYPLGPNVEAVPVSTLGDARPLLD